MKCTDPIITIYNKHTIVTISLMILTTFIVGWLTVIPFYSNLKSSSREEFSRFGQAVQNSVDLYTSEVKNIALQTTSRTRARNLLTEYNEGRIGLESAYELISDLLGDVPRHLPIVLGVTRLGIKGETVASVGMEIPEEFFEPYALSKTDISLNVINYSGNEPLFIADAPIKDREGSIVGNDLVVYSMEKVKQIISENAETFPGSIISLKFRDNAGLHTLFSSAAEADISEAKNMVFDQYSIPDTPLSVHTSISRDLLYSLPKAELIRIVILLTGLFLLGCYGIIILQLRFRRYIQSEINLRQDREQELRDSKVRFETVMDSLDALVYVADIETYELIYLNRYGREIWGEPDKRTCYNVLQNGMDRPCSFCTNSELADDEGNSKGVHVWEFKNTVDNNWYQCRDQLIRWPDGRKVRLEIATNITDLKNMENQLSELTRNLQEQVDKEVASRHKQEQLLIQQSKMAAMGEMIGAIAHQLKQPLNAIYLGAQELEDSSDEDNGLAEIQQGIMMQVEHMNATINDFRNFFKPTDKQTSFKVCEASREVHRLLREKFHISDVQLNFYENNCPEIVGLQNEFKQVVLNIFSNALDVFEERDIADRSIDVFTEKQSGKIEVRIRDNGGGIPGELLPEKLFNAYVSTKDEKGTGIGLQISKTIIEEKFCGRLWAHNVGGGAEFVIEIPVRKDFTDHQK